MTLIPQASLLSPRIRRRGFDDFSRLFDWGLTPFENEDSNIFTSSWVPAVDIKEDRNS